MNIATQLDDNYAAKLTYIQAQTQQNVDEILQRAIELYYQRLQPIQKSPLAVLEEAGLVGCFEGGSDLSSNYKPIVQECLDQKYSASQS
jgi:hypothetical protein